MQVDIRPLLQRIGSTEPLTVAEKDQLKVEDFAAYHFPQPLTFDGSLTSEYGGVLRVRGTLHLAWQSVCDRCLSPVEDVLEVEVDEEVFPPGFHRQTAHGFAEWEEEPQLEDPEEIFYHDDQVWDPGKLLRDLALLALPIGVLCREDCPGLCPQCGKSLALGPCECEKQQKSHSAFDKLADLL